MNEQANIEALLTRPEKLALAGAVFSCPRKVYMNTS
jgi:hypothetical protein